ncbi:hypothetical protein [Sphingomonas dokdonensis]|uniref:Glycosyltransferase RgtA/B/C/D-like domain-containing protein n=1 Tax=Sphingomonas dokdonensis TaxID=344880 RepID=A0A245ZE11_9SPHN|nr:hypothetical protein [Sphingomonas dokdonensis]OWK27953.1 hypothetical protein SPDO_30360 [Sphingomonas dokdonensis]
MRDAGVMTADMRAEQSPPQDAATGGIVRPVLIAWAVASLIFVMIGAKDIVALRLSDTDDSMRLLEVRDWLAGQSWWDVAQHRLNGGDYPMHWSRLVDLPLAAVMVMTTPLLGAAGATRLALVLVPLLTLLCAMLLIARITQRTAGIAAARYAALLTPLNLPLMAQMKPLRIDHHGWQVVFALAAVACLLGKPTARGGVLTGLALAALLTVSIEGLPIAAGIAGVAAGAWAWQPERRLCLLGLIWSLFGGALALHLATRGPGFFLPACDAMSPAWLLTLGVAAPATTAAVLLAPQTVTMRLLALAAAGAVTGAALLLYAPQCLAGPFATLPPLAYQVWYLHVQEGRPLWEQQFPQVFATMGVPVVGLVATAIGWRVADPAYKPRWAMLLALLVAASAVTLFVARAGATANALAIPGASALLLALLIRARQIRNLAGQIVATAAALTIASPGFLAVAGLAITERLDPAEGQGQAAHATAVCKQASDMRALAQLPPSRIFAPLDVTPELISTTAHQAIGGPYHRAPEPMTQVIAGFTGPPARARAIVYATGADYVAVCPGLNEMDIYREQFPAGLWARLARGERFAWLRPVPIAGPVRVWRVIRPLPSPTPRP